MTRRWGVVNILVRCRCHWSRSSILVSRSQHFTFLTVSVKCVFPLPSPLFCEIEWWTSYRTLKLNKNDIIKCWRYTFDSYIMFLSPYNMTSILREFLILVRSEYDLWCHNSSAGLSFERGYINEDFWNLRKIQIFWYLIIIFDNIHKVQNILFSWIHMIILHPIVRLTSETS